MARNYTELLDPYFLLFGGFLVLAGLPRLFLLPFSSTDEPECEVFCIIQFASSGLGILILTFWHAFGATPWVFWLLPFYVVRSPRELHLPQGSDTQPSIAKHCLSCELILTKSRLLNGAVGNLTRTTERYDFQQQYLRKLNGLQSTCQMCTILLEGFEIPSRDCRSYGTFDDYISSSLHLRIWQPFREEGVTYMQLFVPDLFDRYGLNHIIMQLFRGKKGKATAVKIHEGNPHPRDSIETRMQSTASQQAIQKAKAWIRTCSNSHQACAVSSQFLPTRLVRISEDAMTFQVISTTSMCKKPYVALSHCWGGEISVKLTPETHHSLCDGFEVTKLPRNFREAIKITRELGYDFIWVDSLCIIQGTDDWEKQSAMMASVYENAIFTLAATASDNSEGGCFRDRDNFLHYECVLLTSNSRSLFIAPALRQNHDTLTTAFHEKVDMAPLNSRAWVFQERMLSPRILHCGEGFLLFECNTLQATEFNPSGKHYVKESNFHANGRAYSESDLFKRVSPEARFRARASQVAQSIRSLSYINELRPEDLEFIADWIMSRSSTWITGSREELNELWDISGILPFKEKSELQSDWRALALEHSQIENAERSRKQLIANSARTGIRGALDMLYSLRISGRTLTLSEKLEVHRRWFELVVEYSKRNLTKRTDKLVAISGLARRIADKNGMKYYAGLWQTTLLLDLMWMRVPDTDLKQRPKEYVAPSWSWASIDVKVESILSHHNIAAGSARSEHIRFHAKILHATAADCGMDSSDSSTMIDEGYIKLQGPMKNVSLTEFPFVLDFDMEDDPQANYVCIAICSRKNGWFGWWIGLLLEMKPGTSTGMYSRRGIVYQQSLIYSSPGDFWKIGHAVVGW
ncbi:unnamed protein product [Periconia digitata]|uniref:Heterokaryon incompatibility domain-containing protein n=1 Tax=Periconia digitata TaxID=1303443 RepID=A0A9W4UP50_9PLEO|nr:unnamed protein product [Periconia digitata]